MTELLDIDAADLVPEPRALLATQGLPPDGDAARRHRRTAEQASAMCASLSRPRAIVEEIAVTTFARIYRGEGGNAATSPLEELLPRATTLALFTATLGEAIGERIEQLFAANDLVLATFLDAAASAAADRSSWWLERTLEARGHSSGSLDEDHRVLGYSPGYCGWDLRAQRALFSHLHPERIGVTLRESCLMQPLKSVSGVLVAAPRRALLVYNTYPFCAQCDSRSCRARNHRLVDEGSEPPGA